MGKFYFFLILNEKGEPQIKKQEKKENIKIKDYDIVKEKKDYKIVQPAIESEIDYILLIDANISDINAYFKDKKPLQKLNYNLSQYKIPESSFLYEYNESKIYIYSLKSIYLTFLSENIEGLNIETYKTNAITYFKQFPNFLLEWKKKIGDFNNTTKQFLTELFLEMNFNEDQINKTVKIMIHNSISFRELFAFFLPIITQIDEQTQKKKILEKINNLIKDFPSKFFSREWKAPNTQMFIDLYCYMFSNNQPIMKNIYEEEEKKKLRNDIHNIYNKFLGLTKIIPNLTEEELLSLIYGNKVHKIEDFFYLVQLIPFDTILDMCCPKKQKYNEFERVVPIFFEFYEKWKDEIKNKKCIFEIQSETEVPSDYVELKSLDQLNCSEPIKFYYYQDKIKIPCIFSNYKRISFTNIKASQIIQLFKFVTPQGGPCVSLDLNKKEYEQLIKLSVEEVEVKDLLPFEKIIKQYIQNNTNTLVRNFLDKKEHKFQFDKLPEFYQAFLLPSEIKTNVIDILKKTQCIEVMKNVNKSTDKFKENFLTFLSDNIEKVKNLNNIWDIIMNNLKENDETIKQIYQTYLDNYDNENYQKNIQTLKFPSFINDMNFMDISVELKSQFNQSKLNQKLFDLIWDFQITNYINTKENTNNTYGKIAYLYAFIFVNENIFLMLEKLAEYVGLQIEDNIMNELPKYEKDPRVDDNRKGFIEIIDNLLSYILQHYKFPDEYNQIDFDQLSYIVQMALNILNKMTLLNRSVFLLEYYYCITTNLKIDDKGENYKKIKHLLSEKKVNDEFLKTNCQYFKYFKNFKNFLSEILVIKYKFEWDKQKKNEIINYILDDYDLIIQSQRLFNLFFNISLGIETNSRHETLSGEEVEEQSSKCKEEMNNIFSELNQDILKIIENFLEKEDTNKQRALKEVLINVFENIISSSIPIDDDAIYVEPVVIGYFINAKENLSNFIKEKKNYCLTLFSISYIKVFLYGYTKKLNEKELNLYEVSKVLMKKDPIINVLQVYMLKNVRHSVNSFYDFKNFNFFGKQMIWASEYTFKTNFQNDFMEYPFFSEYNNKEDYKKAYNKIVEVLQLLIEQQFRTSEQNELIENYIHNFLDVFVDGFFNIMFCSLTKKKIEEELLYNEYSSWITYLRQKITFTKPNEEYQEKIFDKIFTDRNLDKLVIASKDNYKKLEIFLIELKFCLLKWNIESAVLFHKDNDKYMIEILAHFHNLNYINPKKAYCIFEGSKGVEWFYISEKELFFMNKKDKKLKAILYTSNGQLTDEKKTKFTKKGIQNGILVTSLFYLFKHINKFNLYPLFKGMVFEKENFRKKKLLLQSIIIKFILGSYILHMEPLYNENQMITYDYLFELYDDMVEQLHNFGIENEKIFLNILYCKLKEEITKKENEKKASIQIIILTLNKIFKTYNESKKDYIAYVNELTGGYVKKEIRNIILEQRTQFDNKENEDYYNTNYPLLKYFYYRDYSKRQKFIDKFNKLYLKEKRYPFISHIISYEWDYSTISSETYKKLLAFIIQYSIDREYMDIKFILDNKKNKFGPIYDDYVNLNELLDKYSHRNNCEKNDVNYSNGESINYEYDKIERELCLMFVGISPFK